MLSARLPNPSHSVRPYSIIFSASCRFSRTAPKQITDVVVKNVATIRRIVTPRSRRISPGERPRDRARTKVQAIDPKTKIARNCSRVIARSVFCDEAICSRIIARSVFCDEAISSATTQCITN
jgi:hypothetical protein